jgi:hypothetical protein
MSTELKKASVGLTFIGGILLFLIFGILVLIWPRTKTETLDEQRARARSIKLEILEKDNHSKLSGYAWANKDKGVVQLPIERAMQLVAVDLAAKPVKASAVKVEIPYPYGLQPVVVPAAVPAASGTAAPAPAATGTAAPAASGTTAPQPATTPAPAQ